MKLETDRLLLRSLQPQDVEQMVSLVTDPGVTRFLGADPSWRCMDCETAVVSERLRQLYEDSADKGRRRLSRGARKRVPRRSTKRSSQHRKLISPLLAGGAHRSGGAHGVDA